MGLGQVQDMAGLYSGQDACQRVSTRSRRALCPLAKEFPIGSMSVTVMGTGLAGGLNGCRAFKMTVFLERGIQVLDPVCCIH